MLTLITPLRAVTALFVLTIALAIGARPKPKRCCPGAWSVGAVVPGSIHATAGGYRLTLEDHRGNARTEVWHRGALDATVCDRALVYVNYDDDQVQGFHDGRYDGCWQLRCDRAAYERCRRPDPDVPRYE